MSPTDAQATIARRLRTQGKACAELGSPLYADLLEQAAADAEAGGVIWQVLAGHEDDPGPSALALRLLGAVHRMVLEERAPALAAHYPSAGGEDVGDAWPAFRAVVADHLDELRPAIDRPVQTNEVGRSGALIGGFLTVAGETALPLRILEVGASAGLNLRWDHFAYRAGAQAWGDQSSPVQIGDPFEEGSPPFDVSTEVVERRGCDRSPLDPTTEDARLTLMSFAWPDQARRYADLRGALDIAARVPAPIDQARAADWLETQLADGRDGCATVVFHSVVMQYLPDEEQERVKDTLAGAGGRATPTAPLAWLRMEPTRPIMDVRLTSWPGGEERLLALAGAHGRPVRWLG